MPQRVMLRDADKREVTRDDLFRFTPPDWWPSSQRLFGSEVRIAEVITPGRYATVVLSSDDPAMARYLAECREAKIAYCFPLCWLTLAE